MDSRIKTIHPFAYDLKVSKVSNELLIRGEVELPLSCVCDSCLQDFDHSVVTDDICHVIENPPDTVDLTNYIREDILLAVPQIYVCDDDCKGLCSNCGQNLNIEQCECKVESFEKSPWDELDNLDLHT